LKNIILFIVAPIFIAQISFGQDSNTDGEKSTLEKIREKARPLVEKLVGEEQSTKILGSPPDDIKLPPIPEISKDARSTEGLVNLDNRPTVLTEKEKEYNFRFLQELYLVIRGSNPPNQELQKWMSNMDQGATREGIYRSLVLDANYAGLENFTKPLNDKMIEFTEFYLLRFLGLKIDRQVLNKSNFYTVKRQVVEKTLEVADVLAKSKFQLADWYAVMSAEFVQRYPDLFKSEIRKDKSKKRHRDWALSVPPQHVKSELIIKIHTIFNSF